MNDLLKALEQKAKTAFEIHLEVEKAYDYHVSLDKVLRQKIPDKKWVSLEDVKEFYLAKEHSLRKQFQDLIDTIPIEMEKVGRKYEVYSIGTKKQWIEWLVKYNHVFDETDFLSEERTSTKKTGDQK